MKYIDAEKLIAEIERLNSLVPYESKDRHDDGLHDAYKAVKNAITSLQQEQPEVELEKASRNVYESWKGGTMDDFLRDMVELGKALNARNKK